MNNAATVCCGECVGNLQTDQQRCSQFEWTTSYKLAHVLALDKLHRDVVNAFNLVEIEDGADIRVVQRRGKPRLTFESFEICFFRAEFRWNYFDDNGTAEFGIGRLVNRSLPAHAELVGDAIVAEGLTYHSCYPCS